MHPSKKFREKTQLEICSFELPYQSVENEPIKLSLVVCKLWHHIGEILSNELHVLYAEC